MRSRRYHRFTGDHGELEAQEARGDFTAAEYNVDLDEALAYLRTLPSIDGERIGVASFCMSGRIALSYAAEGTPAAVAHFRGGLYPRDLEGAFAGQDSVANFGPKISCPVLGQFGKLDPRVPFANARQFRNEMEQHARAIRYVFAHTNHAWLNLQSDAYRREQAEQAWSTFTTFLTDVFTRQWSSDRAIWRFGADTAVSYKAETLQESLPSVGQVRLN